MRLNNDDKCKIVMTYTRVTPDRVSKHLFHSLCMDISVTKFCATVRFSFTTVRI